MISEGRSGVDNVYTLRNGAFTGFLKPVGYGAPTDINALSQGSLHLNSTKVPMNEQVWSATLSEVEARNM